MAIETTLKEKYRTPGKLDHRVFDPPQGTWTYKAGRFKSPSNNSGKKQLQKAGWGIRRRAYGPW